MCIWWFNSSSVTPLDWKRDTKFCCSDSTEGINDFMIGVATFGVPISGKTIDPIIKKTKNKPMRTTNGINHELYFSILCCLLQNIVLRREVLLNFWVIFASVLYSQKKIRLEGFLDSNLSVRFSNTLQITRLLHLPMSQSFVFL